MTLVFTNGKQIHLVPVGKDIMHYSVRSVRISDTTTTGCSSIKNTSWGADYCLNKGFFLLGLL